MSTLFQTKNILEFLGKYWPGICGFIIYLVVFIVWLLIKAYAQRKSNAAQMPASSTKLWGHFLEFIYLPILLPVHILGSFGNKLLEVVAANAADFFHNVFRIIFSPISAICSVGSWIGRSKIQDKLSDLRERGAKSRKIKKELKIYQQYTRKLVNIEGSFLKDYYFERIYKFLALLLQLVSFFTTYAGTELFFGGLFEGAPLLVTICIQAGLFFSAITAFRPGKKNHRIKIIGGILLLTSICFSYTGLITLASPPTQDYKQVYESYRIMFETQKRQRLDEISSWEDNCDDLSVKLAQIANGLDSIDAQINDLNDYLNTMEPVDRYSVTTNTTIREENGVSTEVRSTARTETDAYVEYTNNRNEIHREIDKLESAKRLILQAFQPYIAPEPETAPTEETLDTDAFGGSAYKYIRDNAVSLVNSAVLAWKNERMREGLDANPVEIADGKGLDININQLKQLINVCNGQFQELQGIGEYDAYLIDEMWIDDIIRDGEQYDKISMISMKSWEDLVKEEESGQSSGKGSLAQKLVGSIEKVFGAEMEHSELRNLLELRQLMNEEVQANFDAFESYWDKGQKDDQTDDPVKLKDDVLEVPNILFIGFSRFWERGENQGNAIVCILLALLNDGLTMLFGWASGHKAYSFLYIKTSKDYYNDIDELFSVIFKSMLYNFTFSVKNGDFVGKDYDAFAEECVAKIMAISDMITHFFDKFSLSESTHAMGFNLKWEYKNASDIQEYLPLISVLLKTNMMKVVPFKQYQHFEQEYYCGIDTPLWIQKRKGNGLSNQDIMEIKRSKAEGNVLLLKNRAENYLRENMGVNSKEENE